MKLGRREEGRSRLEEYLHRAPEGDFSADAKKLLGKK